MKARVIFLLLLSTAVFFAGCDKVDAAAESNIDWTTDYNAALARAKQEKKPVLLDFYATWCGPCKMMDKQTYTAATVQSEMTNWINVKIDVDKNQSLAQKYNVSSIPTTKLLSSDGKEMKSEVGFIQPKPFAAMLKAAREGK